jgi:8-oxo-dGTP pyrophosphatase MutT (NUDIX family)
MKWTVHGRRTVYESDWVNVTIEDVEIPGGRRLEHHVLRMPRESVAVAVFDEDAARVLLLWRHRFISDAWGWEIPAGWVDPGEQPEAAARREVEEETGWTPGPLTELCRYFAVPGISDLRFTLYRADGATYQGAPLDPSESTRVEWVPVTDLRELIDKGQLTDGPSLLGLSLALALPPPAE